MRFCADILIGFLLVISMIVLHNDKYTYLINVEKSSFGFYSSAALEKLLLCYSLNILSIISKSSSKISLICGDTDSAGGAGGSLSFVSLGHVSGTLTGTGLS